MDTDARPEPGGAPDLQPPDSWSQPRFTADLRGGGHPSPVNASERAVHEGSLAFRAVKLASRVPGIRHAVGAVPPRIGVSAEDGAPPDVALLQAPLYRRLEGLRGTGAYDRLWRHGL